MNAKELVRNVVLAGVLTLGTGARAPARSPILKALAERVAAGDTAAVTRFWAGIARNGSPLVEPIPDDTAAKLVTILYRSAAPVRVVVNNDFADYLAQAELTRLSTSDVWYVSARIPSGARFLYRLAVDDPAYPFISADTVMFPAPGQTDALNPRTWSMGSLRLSLVELPGAPSLAASVRKANVPAGTVTQFTTLLKSQLLGNERKIFLYRPTAYADSLGPYPLLVFASSYINQIHLPVILNNLIAERRIPPVVAVFVDHNAASQDLEMGCMPEYADFLATELLPWVRERVRVTADPAKTIIGGASAGGSSAACIALRRPETFGNVIAQSGAFWRGNGNTADYWVDIRRDDGREGFARLLASSPRVPVRFYLTIGTLERGRLFYVGLPSMINSNRHVRDVLQAKGYDFTFREIRAGHDPYNWEATLPAALEKLLNN